MECTGSFTTLLFDFQCVFTQPSFQIFVCLMTGWVLSHRRRFVTELIWSSGCTRKGHHSRYHRFFSRSSWMLDTLCEVLAKLAVRVFVPTGMIELAVDDTLCRKRGLTVYGTGMHHDPLISSRAKPLTSWGHDWVVITLIVRCPFWAPTKVWSLGIAYRLYRNRQGLTKGKKKNQKKAKKQKPAKRDPSHRTRPELAVELISLVASWFPERKLIVSGDSAYGGASVLQKLPANVELISHVHPKGALYEPAPARQPGTLGAGRKKGKRLPGMSSWADDGKRPWQELVFDQFGLHATLRVKTIQALYYKAGKDRLLTIVLVRDAVGKRPDQMFYCTCLDWDARQILSEYSARWSIEVTFENCKQLLGLEDPANRKEKAVRRTAPMAFVLHTLIVVWFHHVGHRHLQFPDRPWYLRKQEPSFADMLTTLRRLSWQDKIRTLPLKRGLAKKVLAQIVEFLSLAG
jgi:DDE superfamily endonuclease